MINSMTGYGEAQGQMNGVSYAVEIKTVNNRYYKAIIRLPELVTFLEEDIDKLLRNNLSRGTVNYVLRLKDASAGALFDIDETALQAVADKLNRAASSVGDRGTIDLGNLLHLPGIVRPALPDKEAAGQIKDMVLQTSREALDKLKQMRAAEGGFLEADLQDRCNAIAEDLKEAYNIIVPNVQTPVRMLSGGNLQRVILAREISGRPALMVAVQPTRGLDVGAIEGVHRLLLTQREAGAAILLISEELEELFALSDRVAVIYEGQLMGEIQESNLETVGLMMTGTPLEKIHQGGTSRNV